MAKELFSNCKPASLSGSVYVSRIRRFLVAGPLLRLPPSGSLDPSSRAEFLTRLSRGITGVLDRIAHVTFASRGA